MRDRSSTLDRYAAQHRCSPTPSEAALWALIRGGCTGAWFRRQVVIGGRFIADFVAPTTRLIVEVDGGYHAQRRVADARRDRVFARLGTASCDSRPISCLSIQKRPWQASAQRLQRHRERWPSSRPQFVILPAELCCRVVIAQQENYLQQLSGAAK